MTRAGQMLAELAGSNVALTLYFIRFALGLNLVLLAIWAVCAVGPFLAQLPTTFRWDQVEDHSAASFVQGYSLDSSFFLYGVKRDGVRLPSIPPWNLLGITFAAFPSRAGSLREAQTSSQLCTRALQLCVQEGITILSGGAEVLRHTAASASTTLPTLAFLWQLVPCGSPVFSCS